MTQVFISYSRKDQAFVERLVEDLKKTGLDVWYDLSGLEGGSRWRAEIQNAIKNSRYVLVVLSPDSIESEWVEREFLFASNLKLKIIPLLYRQCDLPMNYLNLNFIDVQGKKYPHNFKEIMEALDIKPAPGSLPKKTSGNPPFTLKTEYVLTIIGVFAIILTALFGLPWIVHRFFPDPLPTVPSIVTPVITATLTQTSRPVTPINTPLPPLSSNSWITYTSDLNGNRDIFELNPATGESRVVISDPSHDKVGTWSPVGKFLAFESNRNSMI